MTDARKPVIFCDFDGTITETDNIVDIMKHFDPQGWKQIVQKIIDRSMSIQEGVGSMFALLPSSMKQEIIDYTLGHIRIRAGFQELLDYCKENGIEFLVTSGGIDFFVYPTLAQFDLKPEQIYCNKSDFSEEKIRILWPHPCEESCEIGKCGMCKPGVMRRYPEDKHLRILIGDSVTDFAGAKLADVIFARSHLAEECRKLNVPFHEYGDFYTVVNELKRILPDKEKINR